VVQTQQSYRARGLPVPDQAACLSLYQVMRQRAAAMQMQGVAGPPGIPLMALPQTMMAPGGPRGVRSAAPMQQGGGGGGGGRQRGSRGGRGRNQQ
jgi:hypothetical protein